MMKVLITGSAGFLGRHFATALGESDLTQVDVVNGLDARDFFRGAGGGHSSNHFDLVIHAAAHVGGRSDIEGRPTYLGAYNLQLDAALFEWALRTKPGAVIYLSSSSVYPVVMQDGQSNLRLAEYHVNLSDPRLPDATYGWTKLTGERLAAEYATEGGRVHIVRPFSGYGEDQSLDYPFPSFAQRARHRQDPFQIWGSGQQVRDWIHVDDVVAGALEVFAQDVRTPINLCSGVGLSFDELAMEFAQVAGYSLKLEHLRARPAGVKYRVGDPRKMFQIYMPKVSLIEGIRRSLGIEP
jgi:nucleoside-diphosphate-sugar epimerase